MRWIFACIISLLVFFSLSVPVLADTPPLTEQQIQEGEAIAVKALEATKKGDYAAAETYWTELITQFPTNPAVWSNRGNARVSQSNFDGAIEDFNQAIALAPSATDPYLNRGTAYEGQGKYQEAIADYNQVIDLDPTDAMAYNNRANAEGSLGNWQSALQDYTKAVELAPNFAWAQANVALSLYEMGKKEESLQKMRNVARKYPMFPDIRAALTAVLWTRGQQGEAESNWVAAVGMDNRYQDLDWVKTIRRWPPEMVTALDRFLNLK
jgi:tetratricopeptide (TPR) repeat protein